MTRQEKLEGIAPSIPELDNLIEELNDVRSSRISFGKKEGELAASLLSRMHENNLTRYGDEEEGTFAEIIPGEEKVKVRKPKKQDENGEAGN